MTTRPPSLPQKPPPPASNGGPFRPVPRGKQLSQGRSKVPAGAVQIHGNTSDNARRESTARSKGKLGGQSLNILVPPSSASVGDAGATNIKDDQTLNTPRSSLRGKPELRFLGGSTGVISASPGSAGFPESSCPPSSHSPPPMPARPGYSAQPRAFPRPSASGDPTTQKEAIVKPYSLEPPSLAAHFPGDGTYIHWSAPSLVYGPC